MTQSRIERLLEQMSVQRPSDALDTRVGECLGGGPDDGAFAGAAGRAATAGRAPTAWPAVVMVAVASLVLGMMLGRGFSEPTAVAAWSAGPSPGSAPRTDSDSLADFGASVIPASLRDSDWLQQISAPDVVLICAAGAPAPAVAEGANNHPGLACVTCHTGLPAARRQFLAQHRGHENFAACRSCHDTEEIENL